MTIITTVGSTHSVDRGGGLLAPGRDPQPHHERLRCGRTLNTSPRQCGAVSRQESDTSCEPLPAPSGANDK